MTPRVFAMPIAVAMLTAVAVLTSCTTTAPPRIADARVDGARTNATPRQDWSVPVLAEEGATWEATVAVSPADPRNAVAAGMRSLGRGIYIVESYWTSDGGATWQKSAPLGLETDKNTYARHGDPVLAIGRTGIVYLMTLTGYPGSYPLFRSAVVLYRSFDGGKTFEKPIALTDRKKSDAQYIFDDKEWLAVDTTGGRYDGYLYAAWLRAYGEGTNVPSDFVFARSTDGGVTWSEQQVIGKGGGAQFAIGPNGEVHLLYVDTLMNGRPYVVRTSLDGGETWGEAVKIVNFSSPGMLPNIDTPVYGYHAADADRSNGPHRGNVYMAWPASANPINAPSARPGTIWFTRSTDGGKSWSAPLRLSAEPTLGRDANFATLACDAETGDIIVAWLDRRDDPANTEARLYAARSSDGGVTFTKPQAVTSSMSIKGQFIGHYNHAAAHGGVWLSAFADGPGFMSVAKLDRFLQTTAPKRRGVRK
jgi:hypothetical protein